jgi:hypothetical protein
MELRERALELQRALESFLERAPDRESSGALELQRALESFLERAPDRESSGALELQSYPELRELQSSESCKAPKL